MFDPALTIRAATSGDARSLELLDSADGRSRPTVGRVLLAEHDGVPLAAIALTSGAVLADSCNASVEVVRQLRYMRYRILRQGGQTGAARSLVRRARANGDRVSPSRDRTPRVPLTDSSVPSRGRCLQTS